MIKFWIKKGKKKYLQSLKNREVISGKAHPIGSLCIIQVHCCLWSCPTLCSPHCVWEKEVPQWPLQDAFSVPGNAGTQDKCGCGCIPLQPGPLLGPVCGRGAQAVQYPHTACHWWGWQWQLAPDAPPSVRATVALLMLPDGASPAGCRDRGWSPAARATSPHTLTAANTQEERR